MKFNSIEFNELKGLNFISDLLNTDCKYLVLIQYEDIIDTILISDISDKALNQLNLYLDIAYAIKSFNQETIRFIRLASYGMETKLIDKLNSFSSLKGTLIDCYT